MRQLRRAFNFLRVIENTALYNGVVSILNTSLRILRENHHYLLLLFA